MALRIRKEQVLCATVNNKDVLIREYSIITVKTEGDKVTGALRNIKDDCFDIDCSEKYSSNTYKVWSNKVESIEIIQE